MSQTMIAVFCGDQATSLIVTAKSRSLSRCTGVRRRWVSLRASWALAWPSRAALTTAIETNSLRNMSLFSWPISRSNEVIVKSTLANAMRAFIKHNPSPAAQRLVGHDARHRVLVSVLRRAVRLPVAFAHAFEPVAHVDDVHVAFEALARRDLARRHLRAGHAVAG